MRVYSNFQKAIREAIKQRYAEGNPKLIREDVANIAKSFGKSAEEATATLADMETQIRNNFLDNSMRKEERIKPTLFSQINAIGAPVQQAVDRGIRNKADQQELTKLVERTSNLAAYQARTIGRTAAMGKARGEYLLTHLRNGCRQFRYSATSSHPATPPRAFCQAHTGEVIHINEINKMDNGQGLPVIFYMGGYNCTHTWEAVYNLEEVKKQQASEPAPKKAKAETKLKPKVVATASQASLLSEFVPAKTMKEARAQSIEMFSKAGHNISKVTIAKSIDIDKINRYNKQLHTLINEYELLNPNKEAIPLLFRSPSGCLGVITRDPGYTPDGIYAAVPEEMNFGHLSMGPQRMGDNKELNTLTHEFGHLIATGRQSKTNASGTTVPLPQAVEFFSELSAPYKAYCEEFPRSNLDRSNSPDFVSDYARKSNSEFMAECFADYKLSANPSKYSIQVGKLIDKYFKRR